MNPRNPKIMIEDARTQITDERKRLSSVELTIQKFLAGGFFGAKPTAGAEVTLALRATQLAKMWLGRALAELRTPSPYPESFNAKSAVIEKTADEGYVIDLEAIEVTDEVAAIKHLRSVLKDMEKAIHNDIQIFTDKNIYQLAVQTAYVNCSNGTMWLGMALGAIREAKPVKEEKKENDKAAEPTAPTGQKGKGRK